MVERALGLLALGLQAALSLGLPGVAPREYAAGAPVDLNVNKLSSVKTQLPYSYYVLPYCKPLEIQERQKNLGEILVGDTMENSPYRIMMAVNETCKFLCTVQLTQEAKDKFRSMIDDHYFVNWLVDNMPATTKYAMRGFRQLAYTDEMPGFSQLAYADGFLVGFGLRGRYYVHNHVKLHLKYHTAPEEYQGYRIVGFVVEPYSMVHAKGASGPRCQHINANTVFDLGSNEEITYTYDIAWTKSDVRWSSRWDIYVQKAGGTIHWFNIMNSLMIMLFLSGMVAMILMRTLHLDIAKYKELFLAAEDAAEESGWKLLHGDIFRKPAHSKLLAASVGSGVQILGMSVMTLVFALFGLYLPEHRGVLLQSMILLFAFMGFLAGFTAARLYKVFNGVDGKITTLMTAFLYPGIFFIIFFVLNLFIWGQNSSGAVPFTNMLAMICLWFGISVPLVFLGAYFGFRKPNLVMPLRTTQIPRQIPAQPWFIRPVLTVLVGGILPFAFVFTELYYLLSSLWNHIRYDPFGFLALALIILVVTCAEISIVVTYYQLKSEDYKWWWRAFLSSASSAFYVFLYSTLFFCTRLEIEKLVPTMLYFGYMLIISIMFFLLTGSVGFIASFFFVKAIFGSMRTGSESSRELHPMDYDVSVLLRTLAEEVESREDDEDWEVEDWGKQHVVDRLRDLPFVAKYSTNETAAVLSFEEAEAIEPLFLSVGIMAHMLQSGGIAALEFTLTSPAAMRRLDLARSMQKSSNPSHTAVPDWEHAAEAG